MDEWDVLKAHARAQCVTVKDRLWCAVALALGEAVRALERRMDDQIERSILGPREGYYTRTANDYEAIRKAAAAAEMLRRDTERAERRAAKAAKRAAREERKRMRRWHAWTSPAGDVSGARIDLRWAREKLIDARARVPRWENGICYARDDIREAELRYAIACAEAGAVPGGRVS